MNVWIVKMYEVQVDGVKITRYQDRTTARLTSKAVKGKIVIRYIEVPVINGVPQMQLAY